MTGIRPFAAAAALLLATGLLNGLQAQEAVEGRAASIRFGGRVQTQFQTSSVEDAAADVFLRRARFEVDIEVNDFISGRLQPDFAGDAVDVKDAYVRLAFDPALRVSFGQFKRPFSTFELSSSTDLPIVERDGRIEGLSACPGVGGPCTFSRLTEKLQFDDRDRGVRVDGVLGAGLSYQAALTNGEGISGGDVNDAKSLSGRVVYEAGVLALGLFGGVHDYPGPGEAAGTEHAPSWGVDVEVGTWRSGFHLLGAVAAGDNWKVGGDASFATAQALASWFVPLDRARLAGVEPLLRVSWGDPDRDAADDAGLLLTPGVMVYFAGKNGLSANLDHYTPGGDGSSEWSFKLQSYLYF